MQFPVKNFCNLYRVQVYLSLCKHITSKQWIQSTLCHDVSISETSTCHVVVMPCIVNCKKPLSHLFCKHMRNIVTDWKIPD